MLYPVVGLRRFGRDWLGTMPEPGPSLFIDAEDDEGVIHRRLGVGGEALRRPLFRS